MYKYIPTNVYVCYIYCCSLLEFYKNIFEFYQKKSQCPTDDFFFKLAYITHLYTLSNTHIDYCAKYYILSWKITPISGSTILFIYRKLW